MNVLRGQNRLVLGGSLHWIFHWENNDLQTILKATTQGYLSQFHSCSTDEDKAHFLEEHKLVDILMKTEQKYISTHSEKQEK